MLPFIITDGGVGPQTAAPEIYRFTCLIYLIYVCAFQEEI